MRYLPMGVRACDVTGCWQRWPCATHGTLALGTRLAAPRAGSHPEPMARVAGPLRQARDDAGTWLCCGYHVCQCSGRREVCDKGREVRALQATLAGPGFGVASAPVSTHTGRYTATLPNAVVTDDPSTWTPGVTLLEMVDNAGFAPIDHQLGARYVYVGPFHAVDDAPMVTVRRNNRVGQVTRGMYARRFRVVRDA